ncbi:MAG TPA: hypothetical protein VKU90_03760 [Caulobacteraceae bacterium]|nr:hypothetical protein [Caulobacteraceae bacterium]
MDRRTLLGGLMAAGAITLPSAVWAATQSVKLSQAFAYLSDYLSMTPAKRDRFHMAFYAVRDRKFAPDLKAVVVGPDGKRTPLVLDRSAKVVQLPNLAQLRSSTLEADAAPGEKVGLALELEPNLPVGERFDAIALAASIAQCEAAVASIAGVLSFAAPKIVAALFPGAGSGQALLENGRAQALPTTNNRFYGPAPYFEPGSIAGARTIVLAHTPSRVLMSGHPK